MYATLLFLCAILLVVAIPAVGRAEEELPDFDKLWNYGKPAETEQIFRDLLPQAEASGDLTYLLSLRTQIARTLGLQGKFDEAHAELDAVEKKLTDETEVARIRYLLERGRTLNSSKHADRAKPLFEEAWKRARAAKADFHAIDAAHMMGIVTPPDEQMAWAEKAMAVAEASQENRAKGWLGTLYNNLGWTYFDLGEYEQALEIHQKGWAWRKEKGQPKPTRIAKWAVARMLRALGRTAEARDLQTQLLQEWEAAGEANGFVHEEMGELLLVTGKEEEAKAHFQKAWALLEGMAWIQKSEPERYARLRRLADADADAGSDDGSDADE